MKFSHELADDSPFRAREFIAGKDAVTLATDILALDQEQFSAAFRKSPMKRAKLAGLRRNAAVVNENTTEQVSDSRGIVDAASTRRRHCARYARMRASHRRSRRCGAKTGRFTTA